MTVKLVVRWADITQLEKSATLLLPDAIKVSTRVNEHVFSVFLNINETFKLAEQLANIAMRQLLDNKGFEQDRSLPKLKKKSPKKVSALKRSEKKRGGGGRRVDAHRASLRGLGGRTITCLFAQLPDSSAIYLR